MVSYDPILSNRYWTYLYVGIHEAETSGKTVSSGYLWGAILGGVHIWVFEIFIANMVYLLYLKKKQPPFFFLVIKQKNHSKKFCWETRLIHEWLYVCMPVCMYVCMYVCV